MHTSTRSQKLVIANWKSNLNWKQTEDWISSFSRSKQHNHEYVICPPFPLLPAFRESGLTVGVQDLSPFEAGAYTGAVSPANLEGLGVKYAVLGHSERRIYFGETDQSVAQKVEIALAHDITPVVCVDRDGFQSQAAAFSQLNSAQRSQVVIAYEPVHAISTFGGHEDPIAVTLEAIAEARRVFDAHTVLYGGSVSPDNSLSYLQPSEIDGVLVGGASLDPEKFARL